MPGGIPAPLSNIGQFFAAALNAQGADTQYITISFDVEDPETSTASFTIWTQNTGAQPPTELFYVSKAHGCRILGKQIV